MNNTLKARQVIAEARDLLGGNGILLEYHVIRHMTDIEAIYTYEGTEHIQTLDRGSRHHRYERLHLIGDHPVYLLGTPRTKGNGHDGNRPANTGPG